MEEIQQAIRDRWQWVRLHPEDTGAMDDLKSWVGNVNPRIWDQYIPPEMRDDLEFRAWHREHCSK